MVISINDIMFTRFLLTCCKAMIYAANKNVDSPKVPNDCGNTDRMWR